MARDTPNAEAIAADCYQVLSRLLKRLKDSASWELSFSKSWIDAALNGMPLPKTDAQVEAAWDLSGILNQETSPTKRTDSH